MKIKALLVLLFVTPVLAQKFVPALPQGLTNVPFATNTCHVDEWYVTALNWNAVSNATQYDVWGGNKVTDALTNHLVSLFGLSITNAWFQGTNETYFFRVSANITN